MTRRERIAAAALLAVGAASVGVSVAWREQRPGRTAPPKAAGGDVADDESRSHSEARGSSAETSRLPPPIAVAADPPPATGAAEASPSAPPEPEPLETAQAEAARLVRALETSGPATGALSSSAWQMLEKSRSSLKGRIQLGDFRCFGRGCTVTASFASMTEFLEADRDPQAYRELESWKGALMRSGPIKTSSASVQSVWILFRPIEPTNTNEETL